jgi:hypothetical protein
MREEGTETIASFCDYWIPAFAGMTTERALSQKKIRESE